MTPPDYESTLFRLHKYQEASTAIFELVDNCEEFGAKEISINYGKDATTGDNWLIVSDDGVGFSKEDYSKFWTLKRQPHEQGATGCYGVGGKSSTHYLGGLNNLILVSSDGKDINATRALEDDFGFTFLDKGYARELYAKYAVNPESSGTVFILPKLFFDLEEEHKTLKKSLAQVYCAVIKRGVKITLNGQEIAPEEVTSGETYPGCEPEYSIPVNELVKYRGSCPDVEATLRILKPNPGHSRLKLKRGNSKRVIPSGAQRAGGIKNGPSAVCTRVCWEISWWGGPPDQMAQVDELFGCGPTKEFNGKLSRAAINWLNKSPLGKLLKELTDENHKGQLAKQRDLTQVEKNLKNDLELHSVKKKKVRSNQSSTTRTSPPPGAKRTPKAPPKNDIKIEIVYKGTNARSMTHEVNEDGGIVIQLNFSHPWLASFSDGQIECLVRYEVLPAVAFREVHLSKSDDTGDLALSIEVFDALEDEYRAQVDYGKLTWDTSKGVQLIEALVEQQKEVETAEAIKIAKEKFPETFDLRGKRNSSAAIRTNFLTSKFVTEHCPGVTFSKTKTGGKVKIKCTRQ